MRYNSTRGSRPEANSSQVIWQGIAADGGLFVPDGIPRLPLEELTSIFSAGYGALAERVLRPFLSDFSSEDLRRCLQRAYNPRKFAHHKITPLGYLGDGLSLLELWHGPTLAFKDLALQILPHLLTTAMDHLGAAGEVVILVATSGDTGKAALAGFEDVERTRIVVFYPAKGVSTIQEYQMVTQTGNNTYVVAVEGNFDDAQRGVKEIFTDPEMISRLQAQNRRFSSPTPSTGDAGPQIIYYFCCLSRTCTSSGSPGGQHQRGAHGTSNILAAYYARCMGCPSAA